MMSGAGVDQWRAARALARATGRTVVRDGVEWRVYELPPDAYDRRGSPSLVFESAEAFRRVRAFPEDWQSLSDDELYAVSLRV